MVDCVEGLFEVNKYTNSTFLWSKAEVISSVSTNRANDVDMLDLNPY